MSLSRSFDSSNLSFNVPTDFSSVFMVCSKLSLSAIIWAISTWKTNKMFYRNEKEKKKLNSKNTVFLLYTDFVIIE